MAIAFRHLGFIYWQRGKTADAVALMRHALDLGVTHIGVKTQLGTYLAETGHAEEALRLLEPLATTTTDADALNSLGIAYANAGKVDEARRTFERVLTIDAESGIPLENLGVLALQRNDLDSARQFLERAAQSDPTSSAAQSGLGVIALRAGDRRAAVQFWTRAVQLDRSNYDALYNLATTLAHDGQFDAAKPYLEEFVRSAPPGFYAKDIREISTLLQSHR
jgi:Tfp pilus assembly protein PilF